MSLDNSPEAKGSDICAKLPLTPIEDDGSYRTAIEILDRLFGLNHPMSPTALEYFQTLANLASDYERRSPPVDSTLEALQRWYAGHCDGEREHHHGITIQTCDNPGWWVKVDLEGTELSERAFARVAINVDPNGFQQSEPWLCCRVENSVWHGAGDETKLTVILRTFLDWAEGSP
jgi:hypothetical protein